MDKENLKKILEEISKRIRDYKDLYIKNETAVRNQLVNPILKALDWDIENPSEVVVEDSTDEGRADYSLNKNNKKIVFIEAKNLSADVNNQIRQLAKYSFSEGTDFGLLTNGQNWLLLRSYEKGTKLSDRKLWEVDIINDDIEKILIRFKSLSKDNIDNLSSLIKKQDLLSETWQTLTQSLEILVKPISKIIKRQLLDEDNAFSDGEIEEFTLMKLTELFSKGGTSTFIEEDFEEQTEQRFDTSIPKRVTRMKIRNFSREIKSFRDILVETANYLIDNRLLDPNKIPISSGTKRYIINKKPIHVHGDMFTAQAKLNCGYYAETHNSAKKQIEYARRLLGEAGLSGNELKLY